MKTWLLLSLLISTRAHAEGFMDKLTVGVQGFQTQGSAPSSPVAGYVSCYVLSSDGKLRCKDSSGSVSTFSSDPMTTLGDIAYENATPAATRLAGNTTATKKFLTQTGTGVISAAPAWATIANSDLPAPGSVGVLGAIKADSCFANNFVQALNTDGSMTCVQPALSGLTGISHLVYDNVAANFTVRGYSFTDDAAASTPVLKLTGYPYVAGSATTNKPVFVLDNGSSTGWSTSGTYFGVNANSAFTGLLADFQSDGVSKFKIDYAGVATGNGSGLTNLNASNLGSGTVPAARLPNPSASTLGGIESYAAVSNQWINAISTSGVPSSAQPAFSNISGNPTLAQLTPANSAHSTCNTTATIDWSLSNSFTMTLTNGATCAVTFSNATSGQAITIDYYQPASTGSAAISYATTVLWAGGTAPTMTTGASKSDSCTFKYNGTDYRGSCVQDMR